jgi:aromatic ring-opening dioxygenase catalytic subunit (LigB family)
MGEVVAAILCSHAPGILAFPAPEAQRQAIHRGFAEAREVLAAARPDAILAVSSEHFVNLFLDNMPAFCLGVGAAHHGPPPTEDFLDIPEGDLPGHPELARAVLATAYAGDVEPASSERLLLDHAIFLPLQLLRPERDVPVVPLLQNCQVPPLPRLPRCYRLGQLIRQAIDAWPGRVALLGTGGLSHSPGTPEGWHIDEAFDREFLGLLERGEGEAIAALPDERVDRAGYGTWEVRQWVTVLGAVPERKGRVLAYEPVQPWLTGCAVAVLE